jgi:hypothetical protein
MGGNKMENLLIGTVTVNVMGMAEMIKLHPELIVGGKLIITTCTGKEIELDVNELLDVNLKSVEPETGIEVADEVTL